MPFQVVVTLWLEILCAEEYMVNGYVSNTFTYRVCVDQMHDDKLKITTGLNVEKN